MFRTKNVFLLPCIENGTYIEKCSTIKHGLKLLEKVHKLKIQNVQIEQQQKINK